MAPCVHRLYFAKCNEKLVFASKKLGFFCLIDGDAVFFTDSKHKALVRWLLVAYPSCLRAEIWTELVGCPKRLAMLLIALCMILQAKGVQDSATAAVRVSGLELGGLAGSLTAGFLSDKLVARAAETGGGMVGARVKVCLACVPLAFEEYSHRANWLQSNLSGSCLQDYFYDLVSRHLSQGA